MGMFDEIIFKTAEYDSILTCSKGHIISCQNFQTRSLDRVGYQIQVYSGGLMRYNDGWMEGESRDFEFQYSPYGLIFYDYCGKCMFKRKDNSISYGDLYNFLMIIDKNKIRSIEKVEER